MESVGSDSITLAEAFVENVYFLFPFLTQPEAAILESHGIEVASPSCQSNSEEGEMHEFADQMNHRFSEQVSRLGTT